MSTCEIWWHQLNSTQMWVWRSAGQCPWVPAVYCLLRSTRCKRHSFVRGVVSSICDDTQLYISVQPRSSIIPLNKLNKCSCAVLEWFTHNGQSLNPTKTEVLNIGTRNGVGLMKDVPFVQVAGCQIKPADDIKSLGVTLDCHLSFDKHVDLVCKSTPYHIRALRHIRASITFDMAKTVAHAIVGSKLDYCISLLAGMTSTNLNKCRGFWSCVSILSDPAISLSWWRHRRWDFWQFPVLRKHGWSLTSVLTHASDFARPGWSSAVGALERRSPAIAELGFFLLLLLPAVNSNHVYSEYIASTVVGSDLALLRRVSTSDTSPRPTWWVASKFAEASPGSSSPGLRMLCSALALLSWADTSDISPCQIRWPLRSVGFICCLFRRPTATSSTPSSDLWSLYSALLRRVGTDVSPYPTKCLVLRFTEASPVSPSFGLRELCPALALLSWADASGISPRRIRWHWRLVYPPAVRSVASLQPWTTPGVHLVHLPMDEFDLRSAEQQLH